MYNPQEKRNSNHRNPCRLSFIYGISFLFISVFILPGCWLRSGSDAKNDKKSRKDVLVLLPSPGNPRNSEGDFITLKDGRILFVYSHYTGSSGDDHGNAFLAGRYSSDNGETWTGDDVRIVEQEGKMNVMSVSLLRLQNGEIALFYLRKNSVTDCIPMIRISKDESVTWSEPLACITDREGYFVLNNNRVIQLHNGRLLFAVARHQSPGEKNASDIGQIWSYYSDDNGQTWKSGMEAGNPSGIATQEPGLAELKNGDILMFLRTRSGVQYFSYSKDKGETWSNVKPGNIKSPCSPASIVRIPSTGDLLLVWNDNGADQKRTPLNIAFSKDEGNTWSNEKILKDNPEGVYCYPAVQFADNYILLNYSDWSTMGSTIMKIDLHWVYN